MDGIEGRAVEEKAALHKFYGAYRAWKDKHKNAPPSFEATRIRMHPATWLTMVAFLPSHYVYVKDNCDYIQGYMVIIDIEMPQGDLKLE